MPKSTTKEFIAKAKLVHGELYDYSKTNYTHSGIKVTIICKTHGEFMQLPSSHLRPRGCPHCSAVLYGTGTTEGFIKKANLAHENKYDYSLVNYTHSKTKVDIICSIHGVFKQKPYIHVQGTGCPSCAEYGFNPDKPAYLYYLKVTTDDNQVLYKIGITNRTVNERFNLDELNRIEIIKQQRYEKGKDAYEKEQSIIKACKDHCYKGPPVLHNGNTELFTKDISTMFNE